MNRKFIDFEASKKRKQVLMYFILLYWMFYDHLSVYSLLIKLGRGADGGRGTEGGRQQDTDSDGERYWLADRDIQTET